MALDWEDLRLVLAVSRHKTLSAAAPVLAMTQPTVGRRLRALEVACGSALFHRSATGLAPTEEGQAVLAHAERMEEEALAAERTLGGVARELTGHLQLSSSEWFGRVVLARHLATFSRKYPAISVELLADSRLLDLDRREADVVFRFTPFTAPDVIATKFMHVRYDLFASRGYLREKPRTHRLIGMNRALEQMADVTWLRERYPGAPFAIRSNSRDVQAEACARGAGLAVLPTVIGTQLKLERVNRASDPPPGRDVWLGYHVDLRRLGRLRALVEHLTKAIGE